MLNTAKPLPDMNKMLSSSGQIFPSLTELYKIDCDPLGIHDQSDTEADDDKCSNKTSKIMRGIVLMLMISSSWVGTLYLMKISFKTLKTLRVLNAKGFPIDPNANYSFGSLESFSAIAQTQADFDDDSQQSYAFREEYDYIFDAPFFATWYCSLWNILFLPIYTISHLFCCNKEHESTKKMFIECIQGFMEKGFTIIQFFTRCGFFCVLWMITNYMLIYSLRNLDITVVMALFSTSVSIVYLLSWVVLHQQFVGIRIVAVIICDTGIACLVYMDGVQQHKTLASVLIGFVAAIGSSVFRVFFKRMIGYTSFAQMSLFFTLIGLLNAFLMWPLILLLYLFGAESIIWSQIPWTTLTGSAVLSLTANILGNFGIAWTYELFLTLGIFFAVPLCIVVDNLVYEVVFREMKLGGILLILFGFVVVLLPDNWNEYLGDMLRKKLAYWKRREQMKKNGRVQDTSSGQMSRLRTNSGRVK